MNRINHSSFLLDAFRERKSFIDHLLKREDINKHVLKLDNRSLKSPRLCDLIKHLKKSPSFDESVHIKVWIAYLWIATKIRYFNGTYANEQEHLRCNQPESVLLNGHAVCQGYCGLFKAICDDFNIECAVVKGFSKRDINIKFDEKADHCWNRVNLNEYWHVVEPTWGSCFKDSENRVVTRFEPYYFMVVPEIFLYNHYPEAKEDQLVNEPITLSDFERLPNYDLTYFNLGIKSLTHHNAYKIETDYNDICLEYEMSKDLRIIARLYRSPNDSLNNHIKNAVIAQSDSTSDKICFILPSLEADHVYKFIVFVEDANEAQKVMIKYQIKRKMQVGSDINKTERIPIYNDLLFHDNSVKCLSHKSNYILAYNNQIEMKFLDRNNSYLSGRLTDLTDMKEYKRKVFSQKDLDGNYQMLISLPYANRKYILHVDYSVVDYALFFVSTHNSHLGVIYDESFEYVTDPNWNDIFPVLFGPFERILKANKSYTFKVHAKNISLVVLQYTTSKNERIVKSFSNFGSNIWILDEISFDFDCEITLIAKRKVSGGFNTFKLYEYKVIHSNNQESIKL